jgi:nicotinamide riboside kinase
MLIGFTGAQSTGKSTLLDLMARDEHFRKCSFVKEVTRKVARRGLNINAHGNDMTQLFILSEHLYNHHAEENCMVLDRCIIDGYIYTKWLFDQGSVSEWVYKHACKLHDILIDRLDVVFYTHPDDVPLHDDGVRSVNKQFRSDIIDLYNEYLQTSKLPTRVVTLRGDVNTRMNTIKTTLNNL